MNAAAEPVAMALGCEGLGDCLYAIPVLKKLQAEAGGRYRFHLFTHHPELFAACPYVERAFPIHDEARLRGYAKIARMFELDKLPHWRMDTFDFISVPLGIGGLSFREKQLEYFPVEDDRAEHFDVVLNTSMTWPTRSWPLADWQRLADELLGRGLSVAVVGKDTASTADRLEKRSPPLAGCRNLVNLLSLDQTFFTLAKAGLFVTGQNGLSVLAGATGARIVVLDMSIEWSKRAIYRRESPFHEVDYVKGGCGVYCGAADRCPLPENRGELKCVPSYEAVAARVFARLGAPRAASPAAARGVPAPEPGA